MIQAQTGPRFGPAGLSDSYRMAGFKNAKDAVGHSCALGLNAFEYQAGHGVRIKPEMAAHLAEEAREADSSQLDGNRDEWMGTLSVCPTT